MTGSRLNALFRAARRAAAPVPPPDFPERVARALEKPEALSLEPMSVFDQLALWLPRLTVASALIAVLAIGADVWLGNSELPDELAEASLASPWPSTEIGP